MLRAKPRFVQTSPLPVRHGSPPVSVHALPVSLLIQICELTNCVSSLFYFPRKNGSCHITSLCFFLHNVSIVVHQATCLTVPRTLPCGVQSGINLGLQASTHAEQHNGLQARRLAALSDQLEKSNSQVTKLSISLKQAHAQESSHKWQRDSLQRKLAVCEGEVQALEAKLSAAHMEAAGTEAASTVITGAQMFSVMSSLQHAYMHTLHLWSLGPTGGQQTVNVKKQQQKAAGCSSHVIASRSHLVAASLLCHANMQC